MTIIITSVADTFGRKTLLIIGALLMALAGCVFAISAESNMARYRRYFWHHQPIR